MCEQIKYVPNEILKAKWHTTLAEHRSRKFYSHAQTEGRDVLSKDVLRQHEII